MRRAASVVWLTGLIAASGGCARSLGLDTDPASPIAPRVQAMVDANRDYPRWRDFPAAPTDLPQVAEVGRSIDRLQAEGSTLAQEAARIEWTMTDAEAEAAAVRAQVGAVPVSPDAARTQADIEAFAQELRDRAKAPPPVDRRPIP